MHNVETKFQIIIQYWWHIVPEYNAKCNDSEYGNNR